MSSPDSSQQDYIEVNKNAWNERTKYHVQSSFYDHDSFLQGKSSLQDIELTLLGDIKGKSILHLQCHFGQDSLSLARMGAKVHGVDFSEEAIRVAKETAASLQLDANFTCCDLFSLPKYLDQSFDIVYTTYGTIGWLPDIQAWANIVSQYLLPGGKFIFVEFHPLVWMYNNELTAIRYRYFCDEAIVEQESGTYANPHADIQPKTIGWNHGLAEVIQSLLQHGLQLDDFREYDFSPYAIFPDMQEEEPARFRVKAWGNKVPLVYSLVMHT